MSSIKKTIGNYLFLKDMTAIASTLGAVVLISSVALGIFYNFHYVLGKTTHLLTPLAKKGFQLWPAYLSFSIPCFIIAFLINTDAANKRKEILNEIIKDFNKSPYKNEGLGKNDLKIILEKYLESLQKRKLFVRSLIGSLKEMENPVYKGEKRKDWEAICDKLKGELDQ